MAQWITTKDLQNNLLRTSLTQNTVALARLVHSPLMSNCIMNTLPYVGLTFLGIATSLTMRGMLLRPRLLLVFASVERWCCVSSLVRSYVNFMSVHARVLICCQQILAFLFASCRRVYISASF